jgi:uncharacterized protein
MPLAPHFWTVAPRVRHAVRPARCPATRPFGFTVNDAVLGPVRLSGKLREAPTGDELLVVVHGLGGCADSHYMPRAAAAAEEAGVACLRFNLRGADREGEDFYHAALTGDLHAALARPELARYRRIYLLGYSVGGHLVLRSALDEVLDPRVAAVAAVCPPLDLAASSAAFDRPANWLYRRYILGNLKRLYGAVAARRPVPLPAAEAERLRRLEDWDDRVVAPRHGFAGAADYYARASVASRLAELRRPAVVLAVTGDPMVPAFTLRPVLAGSHPQLTVRWLERGGHVSFPRRIALDLEPGRSAGRPPRPATLESQTLAWLRRRA